ncbi:putative serine peptidase [Podospora didyma]|uniref:Serine peptidase n=1 Tax=Podospora didyma TaxID=330526 RepID=A0AAE0N4K1_9PEZI|nr:putative serine peptidase [Podospora didyma]
MGGSILTSLLLSIVLGLLQAQLAQSLFPDALLRPPPVKVTLSGPHGGNATFQQLINHTNPSLGTFSQLYYWNTTYWKGPGSPVVFFTPGESAAAGYSLFLTTESLTGLYAEALGAAIIIFEHRYYGKSSPFEVLDTRNLQYLTLANAIADSVHFAKAVKLPFDKSGKSNAPSAPWIFVGGSYPGALAAWTEKVSPGTFWAYHASSAPVQAIYDFWSYYLPVQEGMPRNCSSDFSKISMHVDDIIESKNYKQIASLKKSFGLHALKHDDDFASAVASPVNMWQGIQLVGNDSTFFQMCDTIEGVHPVDLNGTGNGNSTIAATVVGPSGVGTVKALANYASWFKHEWLPMFCYWSSGAKYDATYKDYKDPMSVGCLDSYNTSSPVFSDLRVNNTANRQWMWLLCNEPFFWWAAAALEEDGILSLLPRAVSTDYQQRLCGVFFPKEGNATFGSHGGKTAHDVNRLTDGWNLTNTTRVLWVNGEFDPWRSASVSSELRPGGPLKSTKKAPVILIKGARHCNDMFTVTGKVNADVGRAQNLSIWQMKTWVEDFYLPAEQRRAKEWAA